jgi:hypothetical protein
MLSAIPKMIEWRNMTPPLVVVRAYTVSIIFPSSDVNCLASRRPLAVQANHREFGLAVDAVRQ